MDKYKRIMVAMDLSDMDSPVLAYAGLIADRVRPEKIYFVHIHKELSLPDDVLRQYPEMRKPVDERLRELMEDKIKEKFSKYYRYNVEVEVVEGSTSKELIHRMDVKLIDLLILGKKRREKSTNQLNYTQLIGASACDVLLVPAEAQVSLNSILLPVDFSPASVPALRNSIALLKEAENPVVYVHNVYDRPKGGYGMAYQQLSSIEPQILSALNDSYLELLEKVPESPVSFVPFFKPNLDLHGAEHTLTAAKEKSVDLILVASHGKGFFKRFFLGSFCLQLIELQPTVPLLILQERSGRAPGSLRSQQATKLSTYSLPHKGL